jgi:hypothetical protein
MDEIDEAELIGAARSGAVIDGVLGDRALGDGARGDGAANDARRAVRATLLRRCCHELRDQIDPRGLRLRNVVVLGSLDLAGLQVPFPLRFEGCEFDSPLLVEGAELFELSLTGCPRLPGLLGNGLRLRRDLDLSRSRIVGALWTSASTSKRAAVWLCESEIGGRLICLDATIDAEGDRAIQADRIVVGGAVRLIHQFSARGEIRMIGARIGGSVDITGARIEATDGPAIDLGGATVAGNVFVIEDPSGRRPVIRGRFDMDSGRIAGRFVIRNATLEPRADESMGSIYAKSTSVATTISAERLSVGADVMLAGRCEVTGSIDLSMGDLSSVSVGGDCALRTPGRTALDLTNAEISGTFRLHRRAVIEGTLRLEGAVIRGSLGLHGQLSRPENRSLVGGSAMTVNGDVYLDRLRAAGGRINFRSATLGSVFADHCELHNPGAYSLSLNQATVKGSVRLAGGFSSVGLVVLNRCLIEGRLQLAGSFACPAPTPANEHGHAIEAVSTTARGGIDLGWKKVSPSVDFTDASTTFLADDPATWPERFAIAGLNYERFESPQGTKLNRVWDEGARSAWLGRQAEFESGPYEQAAKVFRQHGYTTEAEHILIAQRRHAGQVRRPHVIWPRRLIDAIYATIGYGYRPSRVLWVLAALLVLVIASLEIPAAQATLRANNGNGQVYATNGLLIGSARPVGTRTPAGTRPAPGGSGSVRADSCGDGEVRCFSPVLYAIDTVVPLISLDQRTTWFPDPYVRGGQLMLWWLNLATLLGWLLSSIFVLSLARLSRSPAAP